MIALLLAAQIAAAPPPAAPREWVPGLKSHRIELTAIPAACRQGVTQVSGPSDFRPGIHTLADLPPAHLEIAVERSIGGCPAPIIVRYDVQGDGRAAPPKAAP
jgi:hypothetical protein